MAPLEWQSIEQDPSQEFFPCGLVPPPEDRLPGSPFHLLLKRGLRERLVTRAARHRRQFEIDLAPAPCTSATPSMVQKFFPASSVNDTHENQITDPGSKISLHDGARATPSCAGDVPGDLAPRGGARGLRGVSSMPGRSQAGERGMAPASTGVRSHDAGVSENSAGGPVDADALGAPEATGISVSSARPSITAPVPVADPLIAAAPAPDVKPAARPPSIGWSDWP